VVLGSATPSLESWLNAETGRYRRVDMLQRANPAARLPKVTLVDTRKEPLQEGLSEAVLGAIQARLVRGEQSLVFLNRRGYAPVLTCTSCGWISGCPRCAANLVVHLTDQRLRCHHCGFETRVPKACPCCGNQDIQAFGRGTQKVEAWLNQRFAGRRVLRADRDVARSRKQWEGLLEQIHRVNPEQRAEILVGTQMLAKGHDFPNLTLVAAIGADAALFAADCRAPERLFAQLMQVAGRAGRAELPGEVIIQTQYPDHPLYAALVAHDYPGFAKVLLAEREQAGFPPYTFQAILRAEAPSMATALAFLEQVSHQETVGSLLADYPGVMLYDAVPMRMAKLANLERGQILVESPTRSQLQAFLPRWRALIENYKTPSRLRWHLEVDPLEY
jgi:primosomal protein N' (replication factor Y) (superfamily II helicase)